MNWLRQRWNRFWFEPASPSNLGLCRIAFYGTLVILYAGTDSRGWASVPDVFWMPITLFKLLAIPVLSPTTLGWLDAVWILSLVLACLGVATRWTSLAAFLAGAYILGLPHNFGKTHHFDTVVVLTLGIMAVARAGDAWSVDRMLRRRKARCNEAEPPHAEYTWPVRLVWTAMATAFFAAGVSKLRVSGLEWIFSDNLRFELIRHQFDHHPLTHWGPWLAQFPNLTRLMAGASVALELSAPLALLSRRLRAVIVPSLVLLQASILVLMGVSFVPYLAVYAFWVPWDRVLSLTWVPHRRRAPGTPGVAAAGLDR